jgi:uncharacterized protein YcaQ
MATHTMSSAQARRFALNAQLLDDDAGISSQGKQGVAEVIDKLGYVQIDTIAVVRRAHHHTLWTRRPDYRPEMLHELQAHDRRVFEYWGHAASYLPMSDYRYYLPRMRRFHNPKSKWERERLEKHGHLMEPVLERIREEGPLTSKDFEPPPGTKRGEWWDWKPSKVALELLFGRGDLMVTERRNFQRVYDLTERVLPDDVDTRLPHDDELGRFFVRRALSAHGIAREREIQDYIDAAGRGLMSKSLADLVDAGQVVPVEIEDGDGTDYFALRETIEDASTMGSVPARVILLSPFDNLIIERQRLKRLFDFDYTLECYVPAAKRKYGYFSLPILWREDLVGRLDAKADRKDRNLIMRNLVFEERFHGFDGFLPPFVQALTGFAQFNRCETVSLENVTPEDPRSLLKSHLNQAGLN